MRRHGSSSKICKSNPRSKPTDTNSSIPPRAPFQLLLLLIFFRHHRLLPRHPPIGPPLLPPSFPILFDHPHRIRNSNFLPTHLGYSHSTNPPTISRMDSNLRRQNQENPSDLTTPRDPPKNPGPISTPLLDFLSLTNRRQTRNQDPSSPARSRRRANRTRSRSSWGRGQGADGNHLGRLRQQKKAISDQSRLQEDGGGGKGPATVTDTPQNDHQTLPLQKTASCETIGPVPETDPQTYRNA